MTRKQRIANEFTVMVYTCAAGIVGALCILYPM